MGLYRCHGVDAGVDLKGFPALSELVAKASGRPVPWHKSVVGEGAFTHEAGVHIDGLLKHPDNYQGFDPAIVGRQHRFVLGKHSGTSGVRVVLSSLGENVSDGEAQSLLTAVRDFVGALKRTPVSEELISMLQRIRQGRDVVEPIPAVLRKAPNPWILSAI